MRGLGRGALTMHTFRLRHYRVRLRRSQRLGRSSAPADESAHIESMANWAMAAGTPEGGRPKQSLRCLACREPVEQPLAFLGSLRCLACREDNAPLDPALVAEWQVEGANL
jgi:hypothetical protein